MKKKNIIIACELVIILVLVIVIILLQCDNKTSKNNGKTSSEITQTVSEDIIQKYSELTYQNQTELETLVSYKKLDPEGYSVGTYVDTKFEIKDGKLIANSTDGSTYAERVYIDQESTNKKIVVKGIDENIKTIAAFNYQLYNGPTNDIAVLTENGNVYRADEIKLIEDELTLEFKKLDLNKKIIGLFTNEKFEELNSAKNLLYVLTNENELYYLKGFTTEQSELSFKYEERIIQYQAHQDYGFHKINIFKIDNTAEITKLDNETIKVQYNNETLKIKTLFLKINSEHYINLYIVDENGNIYITKKAISIEKILKPDYDINSDNISEYYELELYNNKKVTKVEYVNDNILTIEYEDGTTEVNQHPEYKIEYFYNAK